MLAELHSTKQNTLVCFCGTHQQLARRLAIEGLGRARQQCRVPVRVILEGVFYLDHCCFRRATCQLADLVLLQDVAHLAIEQPWATCCGIENQALLAQCSHD